MSAVYSCDRSEWTDFFFWNGIFQEKNIWMVFILDSANNIWIVFGKKIRATASRDICAAKTAQYMNIFNVEDAMGIKPCRSC